MPAMLDPSVWSVLLSLLAALAEGAMFVLHAATFAAGIVTLLAAAALVIWLRHPIRI